MPQNALATFEAHQKLRKNMDIIVISCKLNSMTSAMLCFLSRADAADKWACTDYTATGLLRTEAALFALSTLKKLSDEDADDIGILIIDSCTNKLKTAGDLYSLMKDSRGSMCENGDQSRCFNPDNVVIVLSDYSSGVTGQVRILVTGSIL